MSKMEAKNTKCTSKPKVMYSSMSGGANLHKKLERGSEIKSG